MRSGFAYWRSSSPSGGNVYDAELLSELPRQGVRLRATRVDAEPGDAAGIAAELAGTLPLERRWLIDAILAVEVPELIAAAVADGTRVVAVVHHFAADAPDLSAAQRARVEARDRAVLAAVDGIITPSHWAARELERRHGLRGVWVAGPGVAAAGIAPGSRGRGTPGLLTLGALTPLKDQLALIRALALIRDLDWTARVVGSGTADPAYAAVVRRAVADADLGGRITLSGALTGAALEEVWRTTDLLVHPSRSETYGLVVTEALAHGVPAVVSAGTGLVEALQAGRVDGDPLAGAVTPVDRPDRLALLLRSWLGSAAVADRWRSAALDQRRRLPRWSDTAASVVAYLRSLD